MREALGRERDRILGECPVVFAVLDEKLHVGWNIGWLDGTEICANDAGFRVLLCNLYCPKTGACSDVQDIVALCEGCCVESAVHSHAEEVVLKVWSALV